MNPAVKKQMADYLELIKIPNDLPKSQFRFAIDSDQGRFALSHRTQLNKSFGDKHGISSCRIYQMDHSTRRAILTFSEWVI